MNSFFLFFWWNKTYQSDLNAIHFLTFWTFCTDLKASHILHPPRCSCQYISPSLFLSSSLIVCVYPEKRLVVPSGTFSILINSYITARQRLWAQRCLLRMKYFHCPCRCSSLLFPSSFAVSFFLSSFYPDCSMSLSFSLCVSSPFCLWLFPLFPHLGDLLGGMTDTT